MNCCSAEHLQQERFVRVKAVLRLLENDRLRAISDALLDFFVAVHWQAVHENRRRFGHCHRRTGDFEGCQRNRASSTVRLTHADMDIGVDGIGIGGGFARISSDLNGCATGSGQPGCLREDLLIRTVARADKRS